MKILLRDAQVWQGGGTLACDVAIHGDRVLAVQKAGGLPRGGAEVDLGGRVILPGLVNGHDHLDFSTFPALGRPPYASVYEWAAEVKRGAGDEAARAALAVPLADRLFLGGLRNLLAGVTAVAHHNPYHRSLGRASFPVRVLSKYEFAHSPGLTPDLRRTYRTTDRRIPWMVHVAEGTDERCRRELDALVEANVLRQNTVLVHGIALSPEDGPRIAEAEAALIWCPESNLRLYGATAPVADLRAAGVRVGLGSDSPVSGVRDALSNLATARRESVFDDRELLDLATRGTAEAARLPRGALEAGAAADLLVVDSIEALLSGDRRAVVLLLVAGRPVYGASSLLAALDVKSVPLRVDGAERALELGLGRRAASILRAHPPARAAAWIAELVFE